MESKDLEILYMTTALRTQLMDSLTDADLAFKFPNNPMLGELCRELGDVERSYIDSFKTLKQTWDVHNTEPGMDGSVERLKAWYKALDEELIATVTAISDDDFQTKLVDRGFKLSLFGQMHTYREAILIFCGKCDVYLRAMDKPLLDQWRDWIG